MDPDSEPPDERTVKTSWNVSIGDNHRPGIYAAIAICFTTFCFSECGTALNPGLHDPHSFAPTGFLGAFLFSAGAIWHGRKMKPPRRALQLGILFAIAAGVLLTVVLWRFAGPDMMIIGH